jgi:high-affinity Fe2+/Pb2+ permease
MRERGRKLLGTLAIIALLIVYPLAIMEVYARWMMGLPWWGAIAVLAVAGLLWFFPASWVVRWMSKPD